MTIYDSIVMQSGARRVFSGISKLSGSTFGIVLNICVLPNNLFYYDLFLKCSVVQGVSFLWHV